MTKRLSKKRKNAWILGLLSILTLLLFLSIGKRGFIQQYRVRREAKKLREEIEALEANKQKLESEKEKLKDPEYVEEIAREEYGMAKKNERVYRVVPKEKKK